MNINIPLIFLALLNVFIVRAQDPFYINYDTKDGLPSSEVYDIEIDQNGLVWFTTDRGVCTYDGYEFRTYTTKDGLADNTNFEIFRDSKDRLWFNGYNGRLSYFEDNKFKRYKYNDSLLTKLKGKWISFLQENERGMYFSFSFSQKDQIYEFSKNRSPKKVNDKNNTNLFTKADNNHFTNYTNDNIGFSFHEKVYSITWKSYRSSINTLYHNGKWFTFNEHFIFTNDDNGKIIDSYDVGFLIGNTYIDKADNLWVCSDKGLFFFKDCNLSLEPKRYFSNYIITSIIEDVDGNSWVSTVESGVFFVPSFEVKELIQKSSGAPSEKYISLIALKHHVFIGTSKNKIISFDENYIKKELIDKVDYNTQIGKYIKKDNKISFNNGRTVTEKNNSFLSMRYKKCGLCISMKFKNHDRIYVGGSSFIIEKPVDSIRSLVSLIVNIDNRINHIIQDSLENIYIGSHKGLFTISNYEYNNYKEILTKDQSIGRISRLALDDNDNIWMATIGNGLYYYNKDHLVQLNKQNGLSSDLINSIKLKNDSTLLIATNKGLNILTYQYKDTLIVTGLKKMTRLDGLGSNFVNDVEFWNNKIWVATNSGINHFDPAIVEKEFMPVPLFINELVVNDSLYNLKESIELNYDENDVYINYTGISFRKNKETNFYKYKLIKNKAKEDWYYTNEKSVRYNDLLPGNYVFEVSAKNNSGEWNKQTVDISFKIRPHFTQTIGFKLLIGLLLLSTMIGLYYRQVKKIQKKEYRKQNLQIIELKLKEAELKSRESELAALRNQMNPHFVFNSLNSIQNFIFKKDVAKANYYLSKFSTLMRNSLVYSRLDFITLSEEIDFLENYLELEMMRFPQKFKYNFEIQEDVDIDFVQIPSLLLQPILENVVKHAFKGINYIGILTVKMYIKENSLKIEILDNGNGINDTINNDNPKSHVSLGLDIIKNRIKLLNKNKGKELFKVAFSNILNIETEIIGFKVKFVLPIVNK